MNKQVEIKTLTELHNLIENYMEKIIIPNQIRTTLRRTLNKYGFDRSSLFPGLDRLAAQIEWLQSKEY